MAREKKAVERNTDYAVLCATVDGMFWELLDIVSAHSAVAAAQIVGARSESADAIVLKVVPARSWAHTYTVEPETTRKYTVSVNEEGSLVAAASLSGVESDA